MKARVMTFVAHYGRLHKGNQYSSSTGFRRRWSPPQNRRSRDREGGKLSKKKGGRRVSGSRDVGRDSSNPPVLKKKLSCYQGKTRESKKNSENVSSAKHQGNATRN